MTELLTWDNALRTLIGIAATTGLWVVGVTIGASIKWLRERFGGGTEDPPDEPAEPGIARTH